MSGAGNDTSSVNTFPANFPLTDPSGEGPTRAHRAARALTPQETLFLAGSGRFDPSPMVTLLPETERVSLFVRGGSRSRSSSSFAVGPVQLEHRTVIQPVPLLVQFKHPPNNPLCLRRTTALPTRRRAAWAAPTFVMTRSSPFYPTCVSTARCGGAPACWCAAAGAQRQPRLHRYLRSAAPGARRPWHRIGWDFDAAVLYSQSKVREQVTDGFPSLTQILPLLNSGTVNLFGPNTPAVEAQVRATNFIGDAFSIKSPLDSVAARSRASYHDAGRPLAWPSAGVRREVRFSAPADLQTGDISGYGGNFLPTERRVVGALFGESTFRSQGPRGQLRGALRPLRGRGQLHDAEGEPALAADAASSCADRTERASAPSLQDLYLPVSQRDYGRPERPGSLPGDRQRQRLPDAVQRAAGGEPNLKPEKSTNFTLGMVLEPINNVSFGIDDFNIRLENTIVNGVNLATTSATRGVR